MAEEFQLRHSHYLPAPKYWLIGSILWGWLWIWRSNQSFERVGRNQRPFEFSSLEMLLCSWNETYHAVIAQMAIMR
jgi:hypothetical protein